MSTTHQAFDFAYTTCAIQSPKEREVVMLFIPVDLDSGKPAECWGRVEAVRKREAGAAGAESSRFYFKSRPHYFLQSKTLWWKLYAKSSWGKFLLFLLLLNLKSHTKGNNLPNSCSHIHIIQIQVRIWGLFLLLVGLELKAWKWLGQTPGASSQLKPSLGKWHTCVSMPVVKSNKQIY